MMDNKIFSHVLRHRAVYLIAAALLIVGGISMGQSVPDFHALDNTELTGNLGQVTTAKVQFSDKNLQSTVLKTGETLTMSWQGQQNNVKFYLVPEDASKKAIKISGKVTQNGAQAKSFAWEIPANIPSGSYSLGLQSGSALAKGQSTFTVIQAILPSNYVTALSEQISQTKTDISQKETRLTAYNAQLAEKQNALSDLQQEMVTVNKNLQTAMKVAESKALKDASQNEQLSNLKIQAATLNTAVTNMQSQIYKLNKVINTLEVNVVNENTLLNNLEFKLAEASLDVEAKTQNDVFKQAATSEASLEADTAVALTAAEAQNLQVQITQKKEQMSDLITAANQKVDQLAVTTKQLQTAQANLSQTETKVSASMAALQSAQTEVTSKEAELKQALAEVEGLELQVKTASSDQDAKTLQTALTAAEAGVESAKAELKIAQDEASAAQITLFEAQTELSQAQVTVTQAQSQTVTLKSQTDALNAQVLDVKNEIVSLEKTLNTSGTLPLAQ